MQMERKRILEMVKEGKLSTEEALTLLEALENEHKGNGMQHEIDSVSKSYEQDKQHEYKEDEPSSQFSGARDKIMDFVNSAVKKIKEFDFQLNQSVEFPHVFQQAEAEFTNIDIDVANGHVEIRPWDQPDTRVECQAKVYRKDQRDDARAFFIENSYFSVENNRLRFSTQSKWMKVDTVIYVPRSSYEKAIIRTFNGKITAEKLDVQDFKTKTANGKISLHEMVTEKMEAETANGKIMIQNSKSNRLAAETMNGQIDVVGSYHTVDLQSFNGNVHCTLTEQADTVHVKAVTGNIHLYLPDGNGVEGECKSNFGNIKVELENVETIVEKKEIAQKQLKFKKSGESEETTRVFADTKTGSVHIKKFEKKETVY
ncbi:DUF4097 domain-containing protein [Bacillus sp. FJAT-49736]|uniref:DUF4097 family beta strand repeat-containing protein n=1 Tax=Bacillus sp. FJAT-49736 TaxID=2833582 RepID=UPI001BC9AC4D|nr:DUF4097 domain-containing protein [Bacillus sp. FJAT-49736]MBS4174049.1 DUF4097 domain-containing protein [Bacillus sp. FJAT-49736]